MRRIFVSLLLAVMLVLRAFSQNYEFTDAAIQERITKDVTILASDSLQGREAGTAGEYMARMYIAKQFEEIGLRPMFLSNSYFQRFTYEDAPTYGRYNWLQINGQGLRLYHDYYAIPFSGSDSVEGETVFAGYGISMPEEGIDDYAGLTDIAGKIFIINTSLPEAFKKNEAVEKMSGKVDKVNLAIQRGAKAVIFILAENETIEPNCLLNNYEAVSTIPVIFLRKKELLLKDGNKIVLAVNILRERNRQAYNVAGYIDNGADSWIVIGGHYDHLGWSIGEDGKPAINNGADDNATGTAAVVELARYLKQSNLKNNNYIFCAFSGEEKGLIGSTYFTNSKTIELEKINYMIDLDMIGKLNDKRNVTVFGTGTSSIWKKACTEANQVKLKVKQSKSGVGGSDHMPFYYKDIPDIFIHTGLHKDYHTPADDTDKLNFKGMVDVIKYTTKIIEFLNDKGKLPFSKTSGAQAIWGATKMM
jgi:Iap family predicted aminopeptidase